MTNSVDEVLKSDVLFVTGSNTTENHPVIGSKMKQAVKNGAKLIVADPREIELAYYADVFLQIKPGTSLALSNGLMHVILAEELQDDKFIEERTENFEALKELVKEYTPEKVAEICEVDAKDIIKAAKIYGEGNRAAIYYCMGITQHSTGTESVMSIANLAMLTGNIGREGTGVNPLRGQNNVQGACDMGGLPNVYPGYQPVANPDMKKKFDEAWSVDLSDENGLTLPEMMDNALRKSVKMIYIMGENPMVSDPDTTHIRKAIESLDFLVVQDIFLTETAELADVVLPATAYAEKDGTFVNTERRVQRIRKAIDAPGEAKNDWEIFMNLMNRLGYEKTYESASEIMDEIASVTPQYAGIDYSRLEGNGLQWPCPTKTHEGTRFLHGERFARGLGLFKPANYKPSAEVTDEEYPLIMTTGRVLYQYHTRTMTGKTEGLNNLAPESFIEISPELARVKNIETGDRIKVSSRRGSITVNAKVTDKISGNTVFIPFHWAEGAANILTNGSVLDEYSKIPELKVSAVNIEKAS